MSFVNVLYFCIVGKKNILNVYSLLLLIQLLNEVDYYNTKFSASVSGILHRAMLPRPQQ
jgi:hypothetical protein